MNKQKTLRGFRINGNSSEINANTSNLLSLLEGRVRDSVIEDRRVKENEDDPETEAIIMNYYKFSRTTCFGSIIKVKEGKDTGLMPKSFLKEPSVSFEELSKLDDENLIIVYQYYFMLNNNALVTDFYSPSETYPFEIYLNALLSDVRECVYEIIPYVEVNPKIDPAKIKSFTLTDNFLNQQLDATTSVSTQNLTLKDKILHQVFGDVGKIGDYDITDVFNARLVFDVLKPQKMSYDDCSKLLGRAINRMRQPDDFETELKGGAGKIKGGKLLKTSKVKVSLTESGLVNEANYSIIMEKFLNELK